MRPETLTVANMGSLTEKFTAIWRNMLSLCSGYKVDDVDSRFLRNASTTHHISFLKLQIPLCIVKLTLRLLMSYIYMERLFLMFLDHTQRRSTVGKTPLDE